MALWRLAGGRVSRFSSVARQMRYRSTAAVEDDKPEPPNGFLFNEKPLRPGEKRQKEEWENIWVYGMGFNFFLFVAIYIWKPDTSVSTWAKQKALKRISEKENEQS